MPGQRARPVRRAAAGRPTPETVHGVPPPTQHMPTTLITHTAHKLGAVVILAPGAAHFGSAAKALALACTLIAPQTVIPRAAGWSPYR